MCWVELYMRFINTFYGFEQVSGGVVIQVKIYIVAIALFVFV